jgi:hypothetical protein
VKIELYKPSDREEWNDFLSHAKNSHFMFHRDYMEYHADRFTDFSLMARSEKGELVAILPANLSSRTLHSHQGLSFGGLCVKKNITTRMVLDIFDLLIAFVKSTNLVDSIIYKRLPDFYTNYPSQEDLYALFKLDAKLVRRDVSVALDLHQPLSMNSMRKRHIKKAIKNNLLVCEEENLSDYWMLLTHVLQSQHGVDPVHSLSEISNLKCSFPRNIKCFSCRKDGEVIAGTLVFETADVVHTQYLANGSLGRELGGLDLVISALIEKYSNTKRYLSFGISTEKDGTILNEGLISQKESFGARALVHDFFLISFA